MNDIKQSKDISKRRALLKDRYFNKSLYCCTANDYSNGRTNIEVVSQMLDAGVRIIQYREKNYKSMREQYNECIEIRKLTKKYDALLIINDYVDLALAVSADGIHIGQSDLPIEVVRNIVGYDFIIGLSTSNREQIFNSINTTADYIGIGPIYSTNTKKDADAPTGVEIIDYINSFDIPFVCIGGIKFDNIEELYKHNAQSICMLSDIVSSDSIKLKCESIIQKIKSY